jgi:hypothetical protein
MTKKHYAAIAAIIAQSEETTDPVYFIARQLSVLFASDNERFDRERFLAACGYVV